MKAQVENYGAKRAAEYDEESGYDKGNRLQHIQLLKDILSFKETPPSAIIELGCGTGFFSSILIERYNQAHFILVDGSADMLTQCKKKSTEKRNHQYVNCFLQEMKWASIPTADIIFSALTIHHLTGGEKTELYRNIFSHLSKNGRFIYFDQFKTGSEASDLLLEYLACKDMQHKLRAGIPEAVEIKELEIDEIIQRDRKVKFNDNDKEADIYESLIQLRNTGFKNVTVVYQEARYFAIVAFK
jgi:tRNA (cmo5U34)-methyltransferase